MIETRVVCTHCGGVNRLPPERSGEDARCGKCHEKLFEDPMDLDTAGLQRQINRGTLPVLVDVWAPWCGPCRAMAPAYAAAGRQLSSKVRVVKLNSDIEQAESARLGIRGIPTMILFAKGLEIARQSGAMTEEQILRWVRERLPADAG